MVGEDLEGLARAVGRAVERTDSPELRELQTRVVAIADAVRDGQQDPTARVRAADEVDKLVATLGRVAQAAKPALRANPDLAAIFGRTDLGVIGAALTYVAQWLRAPTPESTAVIEKAVAEMRASPLLAGEWNDAEAKRKRDAELDERVKKDMADAFGDLDLKIKL